MDLDQPTPTTLEPLYDDAPDWAIEEAAHDGHKTGAHYAALIASGVSAKRAERLTATWMELKHG